MTNAAADDTSVARAESRRFVLLCGLAPALITVALVIFRPDFVADVDRRAYDTPAPLDSDEAAGRPRRHRRHRRPQPVDDRPVAVASRSHRAADRPAARTGRRGRSRSTSSSPKPIAPIPTRSNRRRGTRAWRARWREGRVVLGYALTFGTDGGRRDCVLHPFGRPMVQPKDEAVDDPAVSRRGRDLQPAGAGAGRRRVRIPQRRAGLRRHSPARAPAHRARRQHLSRPCARGGSRGDRRARQLRSASKNENTTSLELTDRPGSARRQEQPAAALPRHEALVPLRVGGRRARRPRCRRRLQEQDRVRRHDGARHARGGVDAARYAVRRRRSAGDRRRQPAAAATSCRAPSTRRRSKSSPCSRSASRSRCWSARVGLPLGAIAGGRAPAWRSGSRCAGSCRRRGAFLSPLFPIVGMMASLGAADAGADRPASGGAPTAPDARRTWRSG